LAQRDPAIGALDLGDCRIVPDPAARIVRDPPERSLAVGETQRIDEVAAIRDRQHVVASFLLQHGVGFEA
jgi:hypothetical protein